MQEGGGADAAGSSVIPALGVDPDAHHPPLPAWGDEQQAQCPAQPHTVPSWYLPWCLPSSLLPQSYGRLGPCVAGSPPSPGEKRKGIGVWAHPGQAASELGVWWQCRPPAQGPAEASSPDGSRCHFCLHHDRGRQPGAQRGGWWARGACGNNTLPLKSAQGCAGQGEEGSVGPGRAETPAHLGEGGARGSLRTPGLSAPPWRDTAGDMGRGAGADMGRPPPSVVVPLSCRSMGVLAYPDPLRVPPLSMAAGTPGWERPAQICGWRRKGRPGASGGGPDPVLWEVASREHPGACGPSPHPAPGLSPAPTAPAPWPPCPAGPQLLPPSLLPPSQH